MLCHAKWCAALRCVMLCCAVQALNLTTNSVEFVLEGHLPLGEALAGLTGLKFLDVRSHHISGEWCTGVANTVTVTRGY
jgi:hypothetical protein